MRKTVATGNGHEASGHNGHAGNENGRAALQRTIRAAAERNGSHMPNKTTTIESHKAVIELAVRVTSQATTHNGNGHVSNGTPANRRRNWHATMNARWRRPELTGRSSTAA